MPTVPTYNQRVNLRKIDGVKQTGARSGQQYNTFTEKHNNLGDYANIGKLGQALSNLGNDMYGYEQRQQRDLDRSIARESIYKAEQDLLKHKSEMEALRSGQVLNANGADGQEVQKMNMADYTKKRHKDIRSQYAKDLTPEQQRLFNLMYDSSAIRDQKSLMSFQQKQQEVFKKETRDAQNLTFIDRAVAERNSGEAKKVQSAMINQTLKNIKANNPGASKETLEYKNRMAKHTIVSKIAEAHLQDSAIGALEYVKKNKEHFDPTSYPKLKETLEGKAKIEQSENLAAMYTIPGATMDESFKEIEKKTKDPEVEKRAKAIVVDYHQQKEHADKMKREALRDREVKRMFDNLGGYKVDYANIDDHEDIVYLEKLHRSLIDEKHGKISEAQKAASLNEYARISAMSPDERRREDIIANSKLIGSDKKKLLAEVKGEGDEAVNTFYKALNQQMGKMDHFATEDDGDEGSLRRAQLLQEARKRIDLLPTSERTPDNMAAIRKDLLREVVLDDDIVFDDMGLGYQMPYNEDGDAGPLHPKNIPAPLKGLEDNLKYHMDSRRYYVDANGVRTIYANDGTKTKTYKLKTKIARGK